MAWKSKFTGPQIDEYLEKSRDLVITANGWIRINSSEENPMSLNNLKNPGNYLVLYWTNGPSVSTENVTPINIVVTYISENLYQFAEVAGQRFLRYKTPEESEFVNPWEIDLISGAITASPTAPPNPVVNKTLWLDTSDASKPILKIYSVDGWADVLSYGAMRTSIYDTTGKKTDIYQYINDAIESAQIESIIADLQQHIANSIIHVTTEDKENWNSKACKDDVTAAMDSLKPSIDAKISDIVNENLEIVEDLANAVNTMQTAVDDHIENSDIHPTASKQTEWNNKSNYNHTHNLDGRVTITPDHIIGVISDEKMPYSVKERIYTVNSISEMLALTKNPVHNGDAICVELSTGNKWYFVIDDTKLGGSSAIDAFKAFSTDGVVGLSWGDIQNTPTTLSGYGITDAASISDITDVQTQINAVKDSIPTDMTLSGIEAAQNTYTDLLDSLEAADTTLTSLDNVISILETLVS